MTLVELLDRVSTNAFEILNQDITPASTLVAISGLEGSLALLKEKLGVREPSSEEELTNGDVFLQEGAYACAEMPTGQRKWYKKTDKWEALDYDPISRFFIY